MCGSVNYSWITVNGEDNVLIFHKIEQAIEGGGNLEITTASFICACSSCGYEIRFNATGAIEWMKNGKKEVA